MRIYKLISMVILSLWIFIMIYREKELIDISITTNHNIKNIDHDINNINNINNNNENNEIFDEFNQMIDDFSYKDIDNHIIDNNNNIDNNLLLLTNDDGNEHILLETNDDNNDHFGFNNVHKSFNLNNFYKDGKNNWNKMKKYNTNNNNNEEDIDILPYLAYADAESQRINQLWHHKGHNDLLSAAFIKSYAKQIGCNLNLVNSGKHGKTWRNMGGWVYYNHHYKVIVAIPEKNGHTFFTTFLREQTKHKYPPVIFIDELCSTEKWTTYSQGSSGFLAITNNLKKVMETNLKDIVKVMIWRDPFDRTCSLYKHFLDKTKYKTNAMIRVLEPRLKGCKCHFDSPWSKYIDTCLECFVKKYSITEFVPQYEEVMFKTVKYDLILSFNDFQSIFNNFRYNIAHQSKDGQDRLSCDLENPLYKNKIEELYINDVNIKPNLIFNNQTLEKFHSHQTKSDLYDYFWQFLKEEGMKRKS